MFFGLNDVAFLAAVSAPALDPDAAAYIAAVEAADTQALEPAVRAAINDFVVGCKADGIWAAIKASCILAGARTLTGALVPLVGAAPTNFNFASGDYNRKTGLVGDASTKYLNSNRNNNADPQNSNHNAAYATALGAITAQVLMGATGIAGTSGTNTLNAITTEFFSRSRSGSGVTHATSVTAGLIGLSRSSSTAYSARASGINYTATVSSQTPESASILIFRRGDTQIPFYANARLAFYSIGESLDLALLDARVTALINAFDAAI
jgi:hypothetical protein